MPMSSHNHSPKVLVIASAFPPTGGPGVQRTLKFVKYLPQFGWSPVGWTLDRCSGLPTDETLLSDVPGGVVIHRREGGHRAMPTLMESIHRCAGKPGLFGAAARRFDWRLRARHAGASFPDELASWAEASVSPILRVIAELGIDVLYSTFSPASNHLLAMKIREATGLPWVADFRDLWTDDYRYREPSAPLRSAHRRLEQEFLESADIVIGVSDRQTNILASHVPARRDQFVTITNGFDPEDFDNCSDGPEVATNGDRFVLAHVGRFDRWRTPGVFFEGLLRFFRETEAAGESFELRIVGHIDRVTASRVDATGVTWSATGEVSHGEAIREMRRADALLLNVPDGPNADSVIPAKVFEYLAARRPILVVGPVDGEAERIVQSQRAGLAANFDAGDIGRAIGRLFGAWNNGSLAELYDPCDIDQFSRVVLTKRLAKRFDGLAARASDKRDPQTAPLETVAS